MKTILEKIKNDAIVKSLLSYAKKYGNNAEIYLVGGVLRDFYLGKENFDKDIVVVNADVKKFSQGLAKDLDATFIELDEQNKIYRLVLQDKVNCIDIADLLGKNINDDLKRRDLTINSIALNLSNFEVLDVNNGLNDLKSKKIKHISEQNFIDDPLRLLRVFRFQSLLGFEIDNELKNIVLKHARKINKSAKERVYYELLKLFSGYNCSSSLLEMDKTGLLNQILPISADLKTVPPNLHHHLNLFDHSIEVVKQIQILYEKSNPEVKKHLQKVDFGGFSRLTHLKLAAFLHDIGKPSTWTIEEDTGKHRFIKHDDVGSKMCASLLKDLKCSKKQIDYIKKMIKYHIYPSHVVGAPELTDKVLMRFVRKMEDDSIDVIILAIADRLSARGEEITDEIVKDNIDKLNILLNFYLSVKDGLEPLPKLLSGDEIMKMLNIKPSAELGNIIKELKEAQLTGIVNTKDEAILFVKSL